MKIAFCGDISTTNDNNDLFAQQNVEKLFNDVPKILKKADAVVGNLECAVTEYDGKIKKCGPNIKAPFGTIETLKKVGISHMALSNNHIFDYGKIGLLDTIKQIQLNNLEYTGIGKNVLDARKDMIITDGNIKVAIVNVCEHEYSYALDNRMGAREFDPFDTADDIAKAKQTADYVVLIYHGGKEYCKYPSPRLRKLCHSMVNRGADLVLCQHSHCIGTYEKFHDGHILYGQGNFHFVTKKMEPDFSWSTGLIVMADFTDKLDVKFIPIRAVDCGIRLANVDETKIILDGLDDRSEDLHDDTWKDKWAQFCEAQEYYKQCLSLIPDAKKQTFAHFIDCEAHLDVLKQLDYTYNRTNELDDND